MVKDQAEAVQAVRKLEGLDRAAVRRVFDERFTAPRMARDYVRLYEQLWTARRAAGPAERRRASLVARLASRPPLGRRAGDEVAGAPADAVDTEPVEA
jgi:hypothetical protein